MTSIKESPLTKLPHLFQSVAATTGRNSLALLLTGMGQDGAQGLKAIRDAGGFTVAQDEQSSVVWGMPGAAVAINAAVKVCSLQSMPQLILKSIAVKSEQ